MFGFLNVYKPKGKTSHDVVAVLRRVTRVKQIGHTGTLDPFAEGVLPICIGKATRLIEYLKDNKAYIGTIKLGESTTTYDIEGEVTKTSEKIVSQNEIESAINCFRGEIRQTPPIYSALKVNGKKLYEYARAGENVEIKSRTVNIIENKILNYNSQEKLLELYIACSKGTYIRSIANDLGEMLGTYGHLVKLLRIQAGSFKIENSLKLEDLDTVEKVKSSLVNPLKYLEYPKYELTKNEQQKVSNGMEIQADVSDGIIVLTFNDDIKAIADSKNKKIKCLKVFN